MSNPNSFGGGSEIDGQVGMDEWIKNNEDQEISSRVGGNLRTISQAQSLELLDSFESQIKDAEGKLDDLDQMRRSREFEMMRDAIAVRRKELIPDGTVVAESDNVISSQGAEDVGIDAIENRVPTNDDGVRATKIISKDGRVIGYARVARDKKNENSKNSADSADEKNEEGIADELFNEKAKQESTDESSNEETKDDKAEQIATLEARLKVVADVRRRAKEECNYEQEASCNSEYADIVAQIADLKHEAIEESPEEVKDDKVEQIAVSERDKRNREIFESTLESVQEKHKEEQEELLRAIDQRKEFLELKSEEDFAGTNWDNDMLVNRNSNNPPNIEEPDIKKHGREEDKNVESGKHDDNEAITNGRSGENAKRGMSEESMDTEPLVANPDIYAEDLVKKLEDDYVDELVFSLDYSAPNGIRAKYLNEIEQAVEYYNAKYAKFRSSEFRDKLSEDYPDYDHGTREEIISRLSTKVRDEMEKSISDLEDRYASEMRNLNEKIVCSKFDETISDSSDDISADMAFDSAIAMLDEFFSDRKSTEFSGSGDSIDIDEFFSDRKSTEFSGSGIGIGSGDSVDMFNLDKFYKTNRGLEVLFNGSSSYDEAIDALEKSYLEGKALNEVGGILESVLQKRGEDNQFDGLMKKLRRRYEDLGLNDDGVIRSEKDMKKNSWRKRAANAIRKALKMEVE